MTNQDTAQVSDVPANEPHPTLDEGREPEADCHADKTGNRQKSLNRLDEEKVWNLQDAKDNFIGIIDAAASGEPQYIARRDTRIAVVVSASDYDLLNRVLQRNAPPFADMLLAMPQSDSDEELFERITWDTPPIDFGDPEDFDVHD